MSVGLYYLANLTTSYDIPKGCIRFGIGPFANASPIGAKMIVSTSLPYDEIQLEISFSFTEFREYWIYVVLPYETMQVSPYLIYQNVYYRNQTSEIGELAANFATFTGKKSSVINASFNPNPDFTFFQNESVTLSIAARVAGLISINYPLGSRQTIFLTFFGDQSEIWDDKMSPFLGTNTAVMTKYPFELEVQFPKENYLSTDTFPPPTSIFVTEKYRSMTTELNFSYPANRAHTASCSLVNPGREAICSSLTFLSGIFIAFAVSFITEPLLNRLRGKENQPRMEENGSEEEKTKTPADEKALLDKYQDSPLLLEYQMTQDMHNYYGKISWEIASILVAGSLALVGFSLQSQIINENKLLFVPVALAVTSIMIVLYFLFDRISQLVEIHVARLNQIEETLHFHQHRNVHKAHKEGHVSIGGKCYDLGGPMARTSVKLLCLLVTLSVWLLAFLLLYA